MTNKEKDYSIKGGNKLKFITRLDYLENLSQYSKTELKETEEKYKLETKENEKYNKQKIEEIDKKHDKMFKTILSKKGEMAKFLNNFLDLKETIKEENLVQCPTEIITKNYKGKYMDILYKFKQIPIYFLVEHQSTVDKGMLERMATYVQGIMHKEKNYGCGLYPIVVPIVVYTGIQTWNVKTKFLEKQYQIKNYEKYQISWFYNLITVQDFTFEELEEKKTLFSSFMIIEKCKNKIQLTSQIEKMIKTIENEEDKKVLVEIIENIIVSQLGEETTNKMLKEVKKKEEISMSPLTKMLFDLELKGEKRGERRGEKRGITETIKKTAQKMLQKNMQIQDIEEITGLTKEEIRKIEKCLS